MISALAAHRCQHQFSTRSQKMLLHGSVCLLRVEQQHLVYFYTSSYVHKSIGLLRTNRPTALYCTSPQIRIYFRRGFDWDAEKPPKPTKNVHVEQHQGNRLRLQPYILDANLSFTLQLVMFMYLPRRCLRSWMRSGPTSSGVAPSCP